MRHHKDTLTCHLFSATPIFNVLRQEHMGLKKERIPAVSTSCSVFIGSFFLSLIMPPSSALNQKHISGARLTMGALRRFYIGNYIEGA